MRSQGAHGTVPVSHFGNSATSEWSSLAPVAQIGATGGVRDVSQDVGWLLGETAHFAIAVPLWQQVDLNLRRRGADDECRTEDQLFPGASTFLSHAAADMQKRGVAVESHSSSRRFGT